MILMTVLGQMMSNLKNLTALQKYITGRQQGDTHLWWLCNLTRRLVKNKQLPNGNRFF